MRSIEWRENILTRIFHTMAVAIFGVIIAMKYPKYFHFISVVIGLVTSYIVIMIDSFLQLFQLHKQ